MTFSTSWLQHCIRACDKDAIMLHGFLCVQIYVIENPDLVQIVTAVYVTQPDMKQLKGKVKESHKEKRERREDFSKQKDRLFTIVLPTLLAICALIAAYVYFNTRPKNPVM